MVEHHNQQQQQQHQAQRPTVELPSLVEKGFSVAPPWLYECLIQNRQGDSKGPARMNFVVEADEGTKLPKLPQKNFSGNVLVKISKLTDYVLTQLQKYEKEREKKGKKLTKRSESDLAATAALEMLGRVPIELLCRGVVLDGSLDMITVNTFYWKKGGSLVLS
eukprot:CAMPEP_0201524910 /NCGR_PEP_ID=MMETSP0161_2-20130828/25766_1 /ASSEMBLY_ACC=CAM_ASM_000251 /TAXON_ID=180227 /ORGANISM="Neoparamoeba aestuarina, Strain SoJaBio B1-5/56/2" /LENGTH=162 /DNA_ID=CAMNT_0047924553 /DNA_START=201 /DNA_END=685 /DNA_ORIENTATION=+